MSDQGVGHTHQERAYAVEALGERTILAVAQSKVKRQLPGHVEVVHHIEGAINVLRRYGGVEVYTSTRSVSQHERSEPETSHGSQRAGLGEALAEVENAARRIDLRIVKSA